jgi:protein-S-isoprenylcysteine O-methyltransferase Ste14
MCGLFRCWSGAWAFSTIDLESDRMKWMQKMSAPDPTRSSPHSSPRRASFASLVLQLLALLAVLIGILLLSAGRLDWPQACAFTLAFGAFLLFYGIWTLHHDPGQLAERSGMKQNVKSWDKIVMLIYTVLLLVMLILAGLDGGRFHWASVSPGLQVAGWIALILAGGLVFWTTSVNTFLSRWVRIQDDRNQQTVTHGPYRLIRHPMYLGVIVLMMGIPLVLGSLWALVPAWLIGILFIIRTALEDRTLQTELPGYREYTRKVRYRLFPGIW